jgi:hypothetical protein
LFEVILIEVKESVGNGSKTAVFENASNCQGNIVVSFASLNT